jgi:hypothetical protein
MTFTEQQVEWIVMEVIRRLRLLDREGEALAEPVGQLTLPDKLITLGIIEGKLTGISRVLVPPRALVTPAARDELNQRKIELVRQ